MKYLFFIMPLFSAFLLDFIFGDPYKLPHPVRLIGKSIAVFEKITRKVFSNEKTAGTVMALIIMILSFIVPFCMIFAAYKINLFLGIGVESILGYYLLAARCLEKESMKVYRAIENHDIEKSRKAVSMIVGRDTQNLDEKGIIKAAVETIAENTSDGITAPLFYMTFGVSFGYLYKSVNTMDSMVGYKNDRYKNFGKIPAKIDDIFNFIPSRFTALIMIVSSFILGLDGKNAFKIWKRDRFNHASPNSAQTESVCAGALNIQLAGDAYYFGKLYKKKTIGDNNRPIESSDIKIANRLMYCTSIIMLAVSVILRIVIAGCFL